MGIQYRKMEESDLDIFIKMRISQLQEEGVKSKENLVLPLKAYYIKHLQDNTFVSWLAIDDDKIVGTSGVSFVEKPPYYGCLSGKIGLLSSMYVIENYRRQGIAKNLLDKIINDAKEFGCDVLQVTGSNVGVRLYSAYGFKKNQNFRYYEISVV